MDVKREFQNIDGYLESPVMKFYVNNNKIYSLSISTFIVKFNSKLELQNYINEKYLDNYILVYEINLIDNIYISRLALISSNYELVGYVNNKRRKIRDMKIQQILE